MAITKGSTGWSIDGDNQNIEEGIAMKKTSESRLSTDDVFHVLQCRRRRNAIWHLYERDGPVTLRFLAETIAADEHDVTVDSLTSKQRQRVYISLYQSHLPKLDDLGIIEYDKDRGTVESTDALEVFEPFFCSDQTRDSLPPMDWSKRYAIAVSTMSILLLGSAEFAVFPFSSRLASWITILVLCSLVIIHVMSQYQANIWTFSRQLDPFTIARESQ